MNGVTGSRVAPEKSDGAGEANVIPQAALDETSMDRLVLRQAWRDSPERKGLASRVTLVAVAMVLFGAVVGVLTSLVTYNGSGGGAITSGQSALLYGFGGLAVGAFAAYYTGSLLRIFVRRAFHDRYALEQSRARLEDAEQLLVSSTPDTSFAALWSATQARLDHYHDIATSQSRRSFTYGQVAAATGLGVVLVCTVLAIIADSWAGAVAAGLLGGAAAAMSGYIGSTFLRTQDLAATQMRDYFGQPLEFSRFLAAERLLADISDDGRREQAVAALVQTIAQPPQRSEPESRTIWPPSL